MRICSLQTWHGGAVHNLFAPLAKYINENTDHTVDYLTIEEVEDDTFSQYDLVHFNYFMNIRDFISTIEVPFTCSIHHIPQERLASYIGLLNTWGPSRIHVTDPFCARQLGQCGITNVTIIPQAFDHSQYSVLPLPKVFTVGIMGGDYPTKRLAVAREACRIANVPLIDESSTHEDERQRWVAQDSVMKFYRDISCYLVTSFDDGGPLPAQEALLCGRPVVTTMVGEMPSVIQNGINGYFHDGSAKDAAAKLLKVKKGDLGVYRYSLGDDLWEVESIAPRYIKMWQNTLLDLGGSDE